MNKAPVIIVNQDIILRKPEKADIETRMTYGRPREFRKMVGGDMENIAPYKYKDANNFYERAMSRELDWMIDYKGKMIGICRMNLSPDRDKGRYSIGIYDESLYSKGIGTNVTTAILKYAFDTLLLKSVQLVVLEFNYRAIKCYEKSGFVKKKVLKDNALIDGVNYDDVVMEILYEE